MPIVVPVRMHFNMQDLWFNPKQTGAAKGDYVVVSTERGTEFGLVTADPFVASVDEVKGELKPVLRVATDEDIAHAEELAVKGEEAMPVFRELVKAGELDMKPVGVEFLFGGEKVVFYFAAEDRVDFRDLVRDLASKFHQRVDMRQIGVRDEARLVGGYAPCGQELCCVRFGGEFEPVSIRMAKEQDLPLNSAKISGVCGRLMCCLRYEFEAYRDFKQRAPKKNAVIDTPLGKAKIVEYNTPRETLTLRLENGKSFVVALADMTCSEGCCKRSAEQHTPLRPDTVTREALEKLGTPDIVMQLAELDRANGGDGAYVLDDSLLDGARTPRRRSGAETADEAPRRQRQTQKAGSREQQETSGRTPRRKAATAKDQTTDGAQGQARRTHRQAAAPADSQTAVQETAERRQPRGGGMRPRRTSKANAADGTNTPTGSRALPGSGDTRPAKPEPKTASRPNAVPGGQQGGRGTRADQAGGATTAEGTQTRRTRRHHSAAAASEAPASEQARPRRESRPAKEQPSAERPSEAAGGARKEQPAKRRRNHSQPAERKADDRKADDAAKPRRKRRPGDHGGTQDGDA